MDSIFTRIDEGAIIDGCRAAHKSGLIEIIADLAAQQYGFDQTRISEGLQEREKLGSTGFGGGIAIPHCKYDGLDQPVGLFVRLAKPMEYDAIDENEVDLVFALISPADNGAAHLRALAEVSRMLRDQQSTVQLRGASDAAAIYALLNPAEERSAA